MGGLYLADRLKQEGLHASRVNDIVWVRLDETVFADEDDPIYHPRCKDPVTQPLVDSLYEGYDPKYPMTVRDGGMVRGVRQLKIIDGAQRKINAVPAQAKLRAEGKLKKTDGHYMVAVRLFDGDDLACLLERERCQSDNLKRPHSPSVLYASYKAMEKLGATREQIAEVAPAGVDVADIMRWNVIDKKVQARLDAHPSPFGMFRALLDVPRENQSAAMDEMEQKGAVTKIKARKVARKVTGATDKPKRVSPAVGIAFRENLEKNLVAPVIAMVAYYEGDGGLLKKAAPKVFEKLEEIRATVKPGKKASKEE